MLTGALSQDLVDANHILYERGVVDGFGHISARDPANPNHFWISRNLAPAMVTEQDLMCFDLDGNPLNDDRRSYLERFIHAEIYRSRPDVQSVVHSHSPSIIPFTVAKGVSLRPICHMCGFLIAPPKVFEIREYAGEDTNLLISNSQLGSALAKSLDSHSVVLMRGHGLTVVGTSIRQAVFRSVYAEVNAKLQMQAMALSSDLLYLTEAEADACNSTIDGQLDRAWRLWKQSAS